MKPKASPRRCYKAHHRQILFTFWPDMASSFSFKSLISLHFSLVIIHEIAFSAKEIANNKNSAFQERKFYGKIGNFIRKWCQWDSRMLRMLRQMRSIWVAWNNLTWAGMCQRPLLLDSNYCWVSILNPLLDRLRTMSSFVWDTLICVEFRIYIEWSCCCYKSDKTFSKEHLKLEIEWFSDCRSSLKERGCLAQDPGIILNWLAVWLKLKFMWNKSKYIHITK